MLTQTEAKDVLTVDDYGAIRRAHRDGLPIKQIVREFGYSKNTIRKILRQAEPNPIPTPRRRAAPILGPHREVIDQILAEDRTAPPKQRHTAMQLFRRLQAEQGYDGCYSQVQRYVRRQCVRQRETFIPLSHAPGQRLEADFGHIHVDFPDGRRLIPFLVTTWAYSNYPFVLALPFERTEAILEGMVAAFEFFGCIPKEVWWDNPKTVATLIFQGRRRQLNPRYAALASHYLFEPLFCLPARGNEKPDAESTVRAVQRRFATPVPCVPDFQALNAEFRRRCEAEQARTVQSLFGPFQIGTRFAEERAAATALPKYRFDPCVIRIGAGVDKYQTVAFDCNRYSVPRRFAFQMVNVKAYVDRVEIVAEGQVIAKHARSFERHSMVLDPLHYLATLDHRPAALDHSPVYQDWKLPNCFTEFRTELERQHGTRPGTRQFVRVLQLLVEHPESRVRDAIGTCMSSQLMSADAVIQKVRSLATIAMSASHTLASTPQTSITPHVHVPLPDLRRFDLFLNADSSRDDAGSDAITFSGDDALHDDAVRVYFT
jgi:transposase